MDSSDNIPNYGEYRLFTKIIDRCLCVYIDQFRPDSEDQQEYSDDEQLVELNTRSYYASLTIDNKCYHYYCPYGCSHVFFEGACDACVKSRDNNAAAALIKRLFDGSIRLRTVFAKLGIDAKLPDRCKKTKPKVTALYNTSDLENIKKLGPVAYAACIRAMIDYRLDGYYSYKTSMYEDLQHSKDILDEILRDVNSYDLELDLMAPCSRLMEAAVVDKNFVTMEDEV